MSIQEYFNEIEEEVKKSYEAAREAKKRGIDPSSDVEIPLATSLAERILGLVSVLYPQINDKRIVQRISELEKEYGALDPAVALIVAEEISKEKFCKFGSHKEAMEAGIRVAVGYLTLGYVSSPIEGFIRLEIKKTRAGKEFLAPYYSGPIRSAGGSEAAFSLVVVDYLREVFGYAKYDPTEEEIKRGIQECYEYHERITNLQYLPSETEIDFLMRNMPVQLSGDASEDKEVFNYRDLDRVETNFIRSGFCLVLGEGIAQKAPKTLNRINALKKKGFKLSDWGFLEEFVKLQKKIKESKQNSGTRVGATYIQDLVAGRPVFSHPGRSGAFRLRYGRARNTGYSALALNPGTMGMTSGFIAVGTQLKIEKPTKGCTIAVCDSIDGPIVKLYDGSVRKISDRGEAKRIYKDVQEIIYLGDILIPYGDFFNRGHVLEKQGYVEQYWLEELKSLNGNSDLKIGVEQAIKLSKEYGISLHPDYIYYWREIDYLGFLALLDWLGHCEISEEKIILPYSADDKVRFAKGKRALELIGCEHQVTIENVVLNEKNSKTMLLNLGIEINKFEDDLNELNKKIKVVGEKSILEIINSVSPFKIRDKSGTFIGARMGRPEKAKLRKLTGSPHVLFPVGDEGGRLRSFQSAMEIGSVRAEFPVYYCNNCMKERVYQKCASCSNFCEKLNYCPECDKNIVGKCEAHGIGMEFKNKRVNINELFEEARKISGLSREQVVVVKGVRGTSNKDHSCEHLAKGILRAKHNLNVNKDGTIRYDMTEMPITHFKPSEIGTSIERLKLLGYKKDANGKELENEDQVLEIFPHDIILPACPESPDERADEMLLNVSKFVYEEF